MLAILVPTVQFVHLRLDTLKIQSKDQRLLLLWDVNLWHTMNIFSILPQGQKDHKSNCYRVIGITTILTAKQQQRIVH